MSPRRAVSSSWNKMEAKQLSDIRDALYLLEAQLFVVQVGIVGMGGDCTVLGIRKVDDSFVVEITRVCGWG